jgi:hypothetical protein
LPQEANTHGFAALFRLSVEVIMTIDVEALIDV